jgi:UDP-glucose 4-epimerase
MRNMKPEKILVTGAAGFIGSNLCKRLLSLGHSVCAVDNLSQSTLRNLDEFLGNPLFEFIQEDVRNAPAIEALARDAAILVHLAAFKIPRYGGAYDTLTINVHGTESVLKAAVRHKTRVVVASTSDVYGKNPRLPFAETHDLYMGESNVKRWAYAVSKILDEHYCLAYQEEYGIPVTILRFFGGYGPRQNTTWWGGPQSVFIHAALTDQPMEIHGDGLQTRSFTYIDDTIDGIISALFVEKAAGEIFNLGNTKEVTILDLAGLVWRLAGQGEPKLKFVSYQTFGKYEDVRNRVPDISKARKLLGFEPRTGLEEGLLRTIAWQTQVTGKTAH